MTDKQTQTSKTLYKKLSALRATLSDEEQALLDNMITGEFDVEGHRFMKPSVGKPTVGDADETEAHRLTAYKPSVGKVAVGDTDETEAHKMSATKVSVGKVAVGDADETEAHKMSATKVSVGKVAVGDTDETEAHAMPRSPKRVVIYNPDQEIYEIRIDETI